MSWFCPVFFFSWKRVFFVCLFCFVFAREWKIYNHRRMKKILQFVPHMCSNKGPSWESPVRHKIIIHRSRFPTLDFNDHSILWFLQNNKMSQRSPGILMLWFWNLIYYVESIAECKAKRSCKTAFVNIMNLRSIVKLMIQRNWGVFHLLRIENTISDSLLRR